MQEQLSISPLTDLDVEIESLINECFLAETSSDFNTLFKILSKFWSNFDDDPDFFLFRGLHKAHLYRIAGNFLVKFGKSRNMFRFLERGKDLLDRAVVLFELHQKPEFAALACINHAYSYCDEERMSEFGVFLDGIEERFSIKPSCDIYALIQANRLLYYWRTSQFNEGLRLIEKLQKMNISSKNLAYESKLQTHIGLIYKNVRDFDRTIIHYRKAIDCASTLKNDRFLALNLNNLSGVYLLTDQLELAFATQIEAIQLLERSDDEGWLSNFYDTKANILYAQHKFTESLAAIETSISYFQYAPTGKDTVDALFLKVRCLLRLARPEAARFFYDKVQRLTREELGDEVAAKRYELELKKEFKLDIESIFRSIQSAPIVRVDRPASDNVRSFIVNEDNLIYLHVSAEFAEKYLFRVGAALICVEKNSYLDRGNLILLKDGQNFVVGEVFYQNDFCYAEDTFSEMTYDLERVKTIGRIVAISDLALENEEVLFYEA